jgi:hypothetical protein
VARNRWLTPEVWEFADPDEGDDYALKRHLTWERARKANAPYRVQGEEKREVFRFEGGDLVEYDVEYLADSESEA